MIDNTKIQDKSKTDSGQILDKKPKENTEYLRIYVLEGVNPASGTGVVGPVGLFVKGGGNVGTSFEQSCPPNPRSHTQVLILEQI